MKCKCRMCQKDYHSDSTSAEFAGYCSQSCLMKKAIAYGFSRVAYERVRYADGVYAGFVLSPYSILLKARAVGSVEAKTE